MNVSQIVRPWNDFFFRPIPAYSLGLFRIAFASVVLFDLALLAPDALVWYGERGTLPIDAASQSGIRLDLLLFLPRSDLAVECFLGFSMLVACLVAIGFQTRVASVLLWTCIASLHHRNMYVLNSGDTLMRNLSFFLMFAPAGRAFSVDRLLRKRHGIEGLGVPLIVPWAQRLLQIQLCVMYLITVMLKLRGTTWFDGTAVYYILRLDEYKRFAVPSFMYSLWFSKIASWSALANESAMATLVWCRPIRNLVLAAGVALHLALEYAMNIQIFQWIVLASYLLFLDPETIRKVIPLDRAVDEKQKHCPPAA